ncbi:hypothetical protein CP01DC11_1382B, partial [Chlamydia psittaci 01DC11]
WLKPFLTG